jgi:glyoxylase-like metal-dependent hydrolase (beta-lactamase superfamily II)
MTAVRLDELSRLVLAPNPSPMTLEGTNTYLLGAPDHGAVAIVDPGPDDDVHRAAVEAALAGREVAAVVITHHHVDHAGAAGWAAAWGAPLRSFDPALIPGAVALRDGEVLHVAGVALAALHTPGHASDHLCLRVVESDVVLTGDHVLGRGTSVVSWPDGDMAAYMASLRRLAEAPGRALYPGHGPVLTDPAAAVAGYIAHREERRRQVRQAVDAGAASAAEVVQIVYADVPAVLHPAAERSVRAVLALMVAEGEVDPALDPRRAPPLPHLDVDGVN